MANPSLYESLPYNVTDAAQCEYSELRVQDEPDIVWLMQFAALRYYYWGTQKNIQLHMLIKEQLAYFLYIYPEISQYVDREVYEKIRDFTIGQWGNYQCNKQWYPISGTNHNLYNTQTVFGGLKGQQPPGHSIVPNLMMYEVALRDGLGQNVADRFFNAAYNNCEYTISEIDINDPYYAKGQRMSEHVTMTALAYFQEMYPDRAPAGLKEAIADWAQVTIARSDNLWDMRKAICLEAGDGQYTFRDGRPITQDYWTGAAYALADKQNPAPKNEPSNIAGVQAITYAAARVLEDEATVERLKAIGVASIDDLFGRNPTGRAFFYDFTRDFAGGDLGWYKQHLGGYGKLEGCTAVIDANPPESCYPYAPENYDTGYTEGWVAYNTAWNDSLAYSAADATAITAPASARSGDTVTVTLEAPMNLDPSRAETGFVYLYTADGSEKSRITVTETGPDTGIFTAQVQVPMQQSLVFAYGVGLFEQTAVVTVEDFVPVQPAAVELTGPAALAKGEQATLIAQVLPENATDTALTWSSSDPNVVKVEVDGRVTALAEGTAVIIAAAQADPSVKETLAIAVGPAALQSISLAAEPAALAWGGKSLLTVQAAGTDGQPLSLEGARIEYALAGQTDASVSPFGVITAGQSDEDLTITVTVTREGRTAQAQAALTVRQTVSETVTWQAEDLSRASFCQDNGTPAGKSGLLVYKPNAGDEWLELTLPVLTGGEYTLSLRYKTYTDYGNYALSLDGEPLGLTLQGYGSSNGNMAQMELGTLPGDGQTHALRLTGAGKTGASKGYNLALDTLTAVRQVPGDPAPADTGALDTALTRTLAFLAEADPARYPAELLAELAETAGRMTDSARDLSMTEEQAAALAEELLGLLERAQASRFPDPTAKPEPTTQPDPTAMPETATPAPEKTTEVTASGISSAPEEMQTASTPLPSPTATAPADPTAAPDPELGETVEESDTPAAPIQSSRPAAVILWLIAGGCVLVLAVLLVLRRLRR